MKYSTSLVIRIWFLVLTVLALLLVLAANSYAQTVSPSPSPSPSPTPSLERDFFSNILRDQRSIWTAPLHLNRSDTRFVLPLALATGALITTDRRTAGAIDHGGSLQPFSHRFSNIGSAYATGGTAATFYLVGRVTHDARARETGLLGAEALIDSGIVVTALKTITQRPRPLFDNGSGEFFDRGNSFPSGHAISAWSMAAVVACEYGEHRPLVRIGAYGLATAVSLSRYSGRQHFLSDVLIGSALGYGIGRFVYRQHHDPALDEVTGKPVHVCRRF